MLAVYGSFAPPVPPPPPPPEPEETFRLLWSDAQPPSRVLWDDGDFIRLT